MTKFFRFPLLDDATDGPTGGGAAAPAPEPAGPPDDSDLLATFKELTAGGDAHAAAPAAAADGPASDGHPGGEGGESGEGDSPAFGDALKNRARLFGITNDDLSLFQTPEELERHLMIASRRIFSGLAPGEEPAPEPHQEPAHQPAQPPENRTADAPVTGGLLSDIPKEFLDELDPKFVAFLEKREQRVAQLEEQLNSVLGHFEQQEASRVIAGFDAVIDDALGPEWGEVLGNRSKGQVTPAQYAARKKVFDAAAALADRQGLGNDALTKRELIEAAAIGLHQDHYRKLIAEQTRQSVLRNGRNRLRPVAPPSKPPKAPASNGDAEDQELIGYFEELKATQ